MHLASARLPFVALSLLAAVAVSCGGDDADQGAPVPPAPTAATPLGADELIRYDVLDCDGTCDKDLGITADGSYRMIYGTGEEKTGTFDDETFPQVRDQIATTDFAALRRDVADSCVDAEETFATLQQFQFRTESGVEVVEACGPAPGGSQLLAGVMVLATDVALA